MFFLFQQISNVQKDLERARHPQHKVDLYGALLNLIYFVSGNVPSMGVSCI